MRGKGQEADGDTFESGITPAYAGKRAPVVVRTPIVRDHPRLCGEKRKIRHGKEVGRGSPPPMRGKVECSPSKLYPKRITPAYAGKSENGVYPFSKARDHPRLCGEKGEKVGDAIGGAGSPPPMRGKGYSSDRQTEQSRITPAYAGKSSTKADLEKRVAGSPPPMRGKGYGGFYMVPACRITPAYAGKREVGKLDQNNY